MTSIPITPDLGAQASASTADADSTNPDYIVGPLPWLDGQMPPEAQTLPALLDWQASIRPDAPALVAGTARLSYGEFAIRTHTFAAALADLGVTNESRVALLAPNIEEWMVAAYGALRLGITLDTFNTWVLAWDLEHLLAASSTEYLIMVPTVRSTDLLGEIRKLVPELWTGGKSTTFPALRQLIVIGETTGATPVPDGARYFAELMTKFDGAPAPRDESVAAQAALVMYTSGTTSFPKAVPLAHRAMIENGFAIGSRMGLTGDDRVWLSSPLFWSFGGANAAIATMSNGACLVLQERFTPQDAATILADEKCTAAYLLPSMALALVDEVGEKIRAISTLRTGLIIGRPEEVERVVTELDIPEICNIYGSTEVYGNCCVTPHTMPLAERLASQGPPLQGVQLRVVDLETGEVLPLGSTGELQVRGRVMAGYTGNPEATASAITPDGWYRTGDTMMLTTDGTVQFLGRHTDMIKTSGINVSPLEVEAFIATHPAIEAVAVVGAAHPERGEVPVAFVVLVAGSELTVTEVRDFCRASIASFKVPWAVTLVTSIPHTPTGKMMRKDLVAPATELVDSLIREAALAAASAAEGN